VKLRNGKYFIEFPEIGKASREIDDLSVLVNKCSDGKLKFADGR
jgi:hypothetical protein